MSVRHRRLQAEFERVSQLFAHHHRISIAETFGNPPERYVIEYRLRGLVDEGGEIKERTVHRAQIVLGLNYPNELPRCNMLTPVFHPNIDHLRICTEDIGSAGKTIDQVIIFIGEMIAYQTYNVKSPLNGDAARWTMENLERLPLEKVDLIPSEIVRPPTRLETFQDVTQPFARDADATSGVLGQTAFAQAQPTTVLSETCANCGQGGAEVRLEYCVGGHHVCAECSFECRSCQKVICVLCALRNCANCQNLVCVDCQTVCEAGAHQVCIDCSMACDSCGKQVCVLCDLQHCADCRTLTCTNCLGNCVACRRTFCSAHISQCPFCKELMCSECLSLCQQCGNRSCARHLDSSGVCPACVTLKASSVPDFNDEIKSEPGELDESTEPGEFKPTSDETVDKHELHIEIDPEARAGAPIQSTDEWETSGNALTSETTALSFARPPISISKDDVRSVPAAALRAPSRLFQVEPIETTRTSGKAITSLIFGIIGIPIMGILVGPFAIIFGGWALYEINRASHLTGRSLAVTGITLGIIDFILWIVLFIVLLLSGRPQVFSTSALALRAV